MSTTEISLTADFTTPSLASWEEEVLKVLDRRHPEDKKLSIEQVYKRLTGHTVGELVIKLLYTIDDGVKELGFPGTAPFARDITVHAGEMDKGWFSAQLIEEPNPAETRKAVGTDLERGTSAVWVRVDPDAALADKLTEVLSDVLFGLAPIHVSSNTDELAVAEALAVVLVVSDREDIRGSLGIGPTDFIAPDGTTPDLSVIARAVESAKSFSGMCPIVVGASRYDFMGADDAAQLVCALATGIEYVRTLTDLGLSADEAFSSILFQVSVNTNQFITISRLHTLHTLQNRVGEVFEVDPEKYGVMQHAVTLLCEITRDGAYVSVLRGTISAFTATVGQAEFIAVLPLDTIVGLPDVLTRRIARDTQVVLTEESNIGRVSDPTGGVWFVKPTAKQLREKAWGLFGQFDKKGIATAIADGTMTIQLKEVNKACAKLFIARELPLTDISMFPNHLEKALEHAPRPAAPKFDDIPLVRDSQVSEDPRDRFKTAKKTPAVLLVCLDTRRNFGGREDFTSNLYRVGDINTVIAEGINPEMFVKTMQEAGTDIAAPYSSMKVYAVHGLAATKALKKAGTREVWLAGQLKEPGGDEAEANVVIDGNVFDGMNVVELLTSVLSEPEV